MAEETNLKPNVVCVEVRDDAAGACEVVSKDVGWG